MNFNLNAQKCFIESILLALCLLFGIPMSTAQNIVKDTFRMDGTYTVPPGVTQITVEAWGGGGGGGRGSLRSSPASGGGGGAYARSQMAVTAGDQFGVIVGQGGLGGSQNAAGQNGSASDF